MIWLELLGGLIRWALTLGGMWLVHRHIIDAPLAERLTDDAVKHVLLTVPILAPLVWSLTKKWRDRWKWDNILEGRTIWLALLAVLLFSAVPVQAEEWTPALPSGAPRQAADLASYGTLGLGLGLEAWDAFHCADKRACLLGLALRLGVTGASVATVKREIPRDRPCAPDCGIDAPNTSLPSGHAAFAGQTVEGAHYKTKLALAIATGVLRPLANKHHLTDVAAGWGIGWTTTRVW